MSEQGNYKNTRKTKRPESGDQETSKLVILALLFMFVVGVHLTLSKPHATGEHQSSASKAPLELVGNDGLGIDAVKAINRRLRRTNTATDLRKAYVDNINNASAPSIDSRSITALDKAPHKFAHEYGVQLEPEDHAKKVYAQLEATRQQQVGDDGFLSPDEEISLRIKNNEWIDQYDEAYKQEFISAFVENARKDGWAVRLNKNLDIVGMTRVPTDKPIRFPNSAKSGASGAP